MLEWPKRLNLVWPSADFLREIWMAMDQATRLDLEPPAAPSDDAEEDDIELTVPELLNRIRQVDEQMLMVRYRSGLPHDAIIEQISQLMETRNKLHAHFQRAREAEFREFVDGLDLPRMRARPFFPGQIRCKIQIDPASGLDLARSLPGDQQRQQKLRDDLRALSRKKHLSNVDEAHRIRFAAELEQFGPKGK
jgi:hypothetical protein